VAEPSQSVYVDESGRPEVFGKDGRRLLATRETPNYLVLAAVRTTKPSLLGDAMARAAPDPTHPRALHAIDDSPGRRKIVCQTLAAQEIKASAIVMDKRMLFRDGDWEKDRTRFYNDMLALCLSDCLHLYPSTAVTVSHKDRDTDADLQLIVDAIMARHEIVLSRMKAPKPHEITISQRSGHQSRGLQAADYVAYAVHQAFEHRNLRLYNLLAPVMGKVWDLGRLASYTRKNPLVTPPN
jgi:hypothetical protein